MQPGEAGDYAFEAGVISGKSVAGKTIDQIGIPANQKAINNFNLKSFTESVKEHFNKSVDFILLDGRNMTPQQRKDVMKYIKQNHSKENSRLITIGFD